MSKMSFVTDMILDTFKRVLVRFKNAKFGLLFFINIFKIPDFLTDNRVNIFSKFKLIFSLLTAILYIISGIDLIPEIITGMFGFIDDIFVLVWSLGIVNEEIEKLITDTLTEYESENSDKFAEKTLDLYCIKVDNKWYIDDFDEEFFDVLLCNYISSLENLDNALDF